MTCFMQEVGKERVSFIFLIWSINKNSIFYRKVNILFTGK